MPAPASSTVYLITGASRGIGLALVRELTTNSNDAIVLAGVRNPSKVPALAEISARHPGAVDIVKYDATDIEGVKTLAQYVQQKYGRVDVVVANAGIANYIGPVAETPVSAMREHWEINALGPLILFQTLLPLLKASSKPKFIPITSGLGSSAYHNADAGQTAYGSSKAVQNFITKKIHCENEWITAFPLAPGVIDTDMSRDTKKMDTTGGLTKIVDELSVTPEVGARMLVEIIVSSTRATHGGEYINVDGTKLPW